MPTYGLLSSGFNIKPLSAILSDMEASELANISTSLDVQPTALIGILNGIMGQAVFETWELALALYNGMDPDQAVDDQLVSLSLITGTEQLPATKTQVVSVTCNVNAGFTAAPGTMFASIVNNPVALFVNKDTIHNPTGIAANETSDFEAVNTGPIQCLSGTLTVISTPLSGWNSVTNPNDGIIGTDEESNADLRLRRQAELEQLGSATSDSIRADVLAQLVPPFTTSVTTSCTVLFNDSDETDGNSLPPHSIEVIAYQPGSTSEDDDKLAQLIFDDKAAGINTHGNSSSSAFDSVGNSFTINYTRPTVTNIYVSITVLTSNAYPDNGNDLIKAALADYALANFEPGDDVYALHLQSQAFTVPGVLDITVYHQGIAPSPLTGNNITIDVRHVASLSTGNITVSVV